MKKVCEESKGQERWDEYGKTRIKDIQENPEKYAIQDSPLRNWAMHDELMALLAPLQDKEILELGCGFGRFSVYLAKMGAKITGVDVGPQLIAASKTLAEVNQVECKFEEANIVNLPFKSNIYDILIGIQVLHHLSDRDVCDALRESHRVLKPGGTAIFYEPVENSRVFNFIQNLFPAGKKGTHWYRPSILRRKAWRNYVNNLDDRAMRNRELVSAGKKWFRDVHLSPYGFLIRLERLIGKGSHNTLLVLDKVIFKIFPPLKYLCQTVLIEYHK